MASLFPIIILSASIYVILKSTDLLVGISSSLGHKLKLSDYFIGSFIVGISTSLPELFTSVAAVFTGVPQLVVPTIYGTIAANIAAGFGLGVVALYFFVKKNGRVRLLSWRAPLAGGCLDFGVLEVPSRFLGIPVAFAVSSVVLTGGFYMLGYFGHWHAVLFLALYLIFFAWELKRRNLESQAPPAAQADLAVAPSGSSVAGRWHAAWDFIRTLGVPFLALGVFLFVALNPKHAPLEAFLGNPTGALFFISGLALIAGFLTVMLFRWKLQAPSTDFAAYISATLHSFSRLTLVLCLLITVVVIYFSGVAIVEAVGWTAEVMGIADTVLAASALAIGTSLPDIVVAITVARAGRHMLLFGHILQSNTFDVFLVMGFCGMLSPMITGHSFEAGLSIFCSVLFTAALIPVIWTRRFSLMPAALLVASFCAFIAMLFG